MHRIAVIAGDGVGPEVVAVGQRVVDAAAGPGALAWDEFGWGSAWYHEHGEMMPADGIDQLRGYDAIYLGAVGSPDVPDHVTLWGLLLPIRQRFDLYVNLRPVRLLPGVPRRWRAAPATTSTWCACGRTPRASTAEWAAGCTRGGAHEVGIQVDVFTRHGVERVARYAFELARSPARRLASITKSNASPHHFVMWDEVCDAGGTREFPDVAYEQLLVDAACAYMVTQPQRFDVLVASNLFGDILTDIGAAIQGGMGLAASANLPDGPGCRDCSSRCTARRRTSPGTGKANPIGAVWAGAMMLEALGERGRCPG